MGFIPLQFGGGGGSLINYISICYYYIFNLNTVIMPPNVPPLYVSAWPQLLEGSMISITTGKALSATAGSAVRIFG